MKRLGLAVVLLAATAGAAMAADSPFAGTWKLNVEKSHFTGETFTYAKTATGYHFSNGGAIAYDFAIDGKDYTILANRTVSWTKVGDSAWDSVVKAGGAVLSKSHRVLSADGKTLTVTRTVYRPDGTTIDESDVYSRVGGGAGLAGKWREVKAEGGAETLVIAAPAAGKFEIDNSAFKSTIVGTTDGAPAPITGPLAPAGLTASYKAMGANEWDYATTLGGKVLQKGAMTVSADGKTLTDASWDPGKQSEKTMAVYDKQ